MDIYLDYFSKPSKLTMRSVLFGPGPDSALLATHETNEGRTVDNTVMMSTAVWNTTEIFNRCLIGVYMCYYINIAYTAKTTILY